MEEAILNVVVDGAEAQPVQKQGHKESLPHSGLLVVVFSSV